MRFVELTFEDIAQALQDWGPASPHAGIVALLPEAESAKLPLLQEAATRAGFKLLGAIFPALLRDQAFVTQGACLLHFPKMPPHFLLSDINVGGQPADDIVAAMRPLLEVDASSTSRPTLFMIFDSMVPNIASILDALYLRLANRVEYAGVNAGSETFQPMPCLFNAERVVGNGVIGFVLPPDRVPLLAHGFVRPERSMGATSTQGNRIATIDWRPAFEVYQEIIAAQFGIELTRENFYQYGVHYPFGILRSNGDVVVRIPVALEEDGSVYCVGEIPENSMLVLLKAPEPDNDSIAQLASGMESVHGSLQGRPLLTFYCAGRRMHFGDTAEDELKRLMRETGAACLGGALSLGEIGNTERWGYPMFHNATLVCTPWNAS